MKEQLNHNELEDFIREHSVDDMPPEAESKLRIQLYNFRNKFHSEESKSFSFFDLIHLQKVKYGLAFVIVFAFIIVASRYISFYSNHNKLYAAVIQQLKQMETMSYKFLFTNDVTAEIQYKEPGLFRINLSWGIEFRNNLAEKKQIFIIHYLKKYVINMLDGTEDFKDVYQFYNEMKNMPLRADEKLGERIIDGVKTVGFRAKQENDMTLCKDIWIDPVSLNIVKAEFNFFHKDIKLHQMEIVNIKLNEPIDSKLFNIEAPEGYNLLSENEREKIDSLKLY